MSSPFHPLFDPVKALSPPTSLMATLVFFKFSQVMKFGLCAIPFASFFHSWLGFTPVHFSFSIKLYSSSPLSHRPCNFHFVATHLILIINLWLYSYVGWRRWWHPTPVLLPGKSHGWRSLVGCRLWGCTESDTTEATWQQQQQLCICWFNVFFCL